MSRILHIFCGPFSTRQGTQVLVGQTCRLSAEAGHEVHLLTYAHGSSYPKEPFEIHRIPDFPRFNSERSGLAWQKPLLDLSVAMRTRDLCAKLRPDILHVHHYEALLAAQWARLSGPPILFHLHAMFGPELGTYVSKSLFGVATMVGRTLDRIGPHLADLTVTVHPWITKQLLNMGHNPQTVHTLKPPFELPNSPVVSAATKDFDVFNLLYTGNLDAYQNMETLFDALALLPKGFLEKIKLKIATDSRFSPSLYPSITPEILARIEIVEHSTYPQIISLIKSADLVIVPRQTPGGAPIKLINALACGAPVLVDSIVADGIVHGREAWLVDMSCTDAVASAITDLINNPELAQRLKKGALVASKREHSPTKYVQDLNQYYRDL